MGPYKAALFEPHLSVLHALKSTLYAQTGIPLVRWWCDLIFLLEKICSNSIVNKLRATCLFKTDFNWWNKLIFVKNI